MGLSGGLPTLQAYQGQQQPRAPDGEGGLARPSRVAPSCLPAPHKERAGGAEPPARPLPGSSEEKADAGAARGRRQPRAPLPSRRGPHLLSRAAAAPRQAAPKAGSPPTTRGRTRRRLGSFFKRRSSLGRRRRGCRLLPPPLQPLPGVADRGHSAWAKRPSLRRQPPPSALRLFPGASRLRRAPLRRVARPSLRLLP